MSTTSQLGAAQLGTIELASAVTSPPPPPPPPFGLDDETGTAPTFVRANAPLKQLYLDDDAMVFMSAVVDEENDTGQRAAVVYQRQSNTWITGVVTDDEVGARLIPPPPPPSPPPTHNRLFVPRVPDIDTARGKDRLRYHTEVVQNILNSLIAQGLIEQTGPASYTIVGLGGTYYAPGLLSPYAGAGIPPGGWLLCDGSLHNVTDYPALFAVIGYTYGGAGTQFAVPNLIGHLI